MRPPTIEVTAAPDGNIVPLQSMNDLQHHGDQHIVLNAGFKIPSPTRRGVAMAVRLPQRPLRRTDYSQ